jgi:uncharacterized protein (TIGR03435 family)
LVGIAHTESPLNLYGVDAVPATFLVDAKGRIAGSIDPELLSASMLEDLMVGRTLPAINLTIRPHYATNLVSGARSARNSLVMSGGLRSIVSFLWGIQHSRITGEPLDDTTVYDLSLSIPGATPANFRSWAGDVVAAAFHVKVKHETRDMEVWILAKTPDKPAALKPAGTISDLTNVGLVTATPPAVGRSLKLVYSEVSFIAQFLESAAGKPVVDETGITGKYDIQVPFDTVDSTGVIEAIRKAGFRIELARRMIELLVVNRAE